jgi:type I restriction enzyme M protein
MSEATVLDCRRPQSPQGIFWEAEKKLTAAASGRRKIGKTDYQAQGVPYIPEKARFATLLNLPEGADIGKAINEAMKSIGKIVWNE